VRRLVLFLLAVLAMTSCAPAPQESSGPASDAGAFPVTITHRFGATTISSGPKRIVALSFEEDALSLVGIAPVGHADNAYEPGRPYP